MNRFFFGLDLGKVHDYTATAVIERAELRGSFDHAQWAYRKVVELRLRFLRRTPLGTSYPQVVAQTVDLTRHPTFDGRVDLSVDATGVGRPVIDMLRDAPRRGRLRPVIVSPGELQHETNGFYYVPKRDLISGLELLFQTGGLKIAEDLEERQALIEELLAMERRSTAGGREQFGVWRSGKHDDLVFAVALAVWGVQEAHCWSETHWFNRDEAMMAEEFRETMDQMRWGDSR
jgi:hypothetical protein